MYVKSTKFQCNANNELQCEYMHVCVMTTKIPSREIENVVCFNIQTGEKYIYSTDGRIWVRWEEKKRKQWRKAEQASEQNRAIQEQKRVKVGERVQKERNRSKAQKGERFSSKKTRLLRVKSEYTVWYGQVMSSRWQARHTSKSDSRRAEHPTKERLPSVLLSVWQSEWVCRNNLFLHTTF